MPTLEGGNTSTSNSDDRDSRLSAQHAQLPDFRQRVCLAPMVQGSELAFRTVIRRHGVQTCYSPMLRAEQVVQAHQQWKKLRQQEQTFAVENLRKLIRHEDGILFVEDIMKDPDPVVVQLCGNAPDVLATAVCALLEVKHDDTQIDSETEDTSKPKIVGIDLNLGCPQKCASVGGFGAFLAENNPSLAVACIAAMRKAIDDDSKNKTTETTRVKPRLSCKMRLLESHEATLAFATQLVQAGCEQLAVHCRRRKDKHNGRPDFVAGRRLVIDLADRIPVVINGGVETMDGIQDALQRTKASSVMIATGFLRNPRLLDEPNADPASLAAEYLQECKLYPPPSSLYIRKHLRWIFRPYLEPIKSQPIDYAKDWRPRLWTFLVRPYLETLEQFRQVIVLYVNLSQSSPTLKCSLPESLKLEPPNPTFASIRHHPSRTQKNKTSQGTNGDATIDPSDKDMSRKRKHSGGGGY